MTTNNSGSPAVQLINDGKPGVSSSLNELLYLPCSPAGWKRIGEITFLGEFSKIVSRQLNRDHFLWVYPCYLYIHGP